MSPSKRKQTAFRIDREILAGLQTVKERDGVPISEQVRRALVAWLSGQGVVGKAASRRVVARRKA
jgi:hypothetical protein